MAGGGDARGHPEHCRLGRSAKGGRDARAPATSGLSVGSSGFSRFFRLKAGLRTWDCESVGQQLVEFPISGSLTKTYRKKGRDRNSATVSLYVVCVRESRALAIHAMTKGCSDRAHRKYRYAKMVECCTNALRTASYTDSGGWEVVSCASQRPGSDVSICQRTTGQPARR
jgi:hypothetical protein